MNLSWKVLNYNCNANKIEPYDVLKYRIDWMKKLKKKSKDIGEFTEKLNNEMLWQYWSRAEYELILEKCNNELWLKPWCECHNPEEVKINVTEDNFWQEFAKQHDNWWDNEAKIDIYDQLKFKWPEFVDYCWNTRLPYERKRKDV